MPLTLHRALDAWPGERFTSTLKTEIESLPPGSLPLAEGGALGGYVDDASIVATILCAVDDEEHIAADVGIFFGEILAGCSCGDEPEMQNAYCELRVSIDKQSAAATFSLREHA